MITAKDILDMTEVCDILLPIEVATREVCGEQYVTCSKVIPLTRMINIKISGLQPKSTIGINLQKNILTEIKKRLLPSESVNILALSTLLDPRFKNIHFQDAISCSKAIRYIKDLITTVDDRNTDQQERASEIHNGTDQKITEDAIKKWLRRAKEWQHTQK
ncbi:hypothetical protein NQ314_003303 [Rhamnusium bicolor]|uniref:Uncharacterized protein n=1 Tax=Rhamnusium bicolor TaxID=1586634 RepID=A0AAV8ZMF1_9CUCU|nr:hypothetical protein NQ314_003303 [Rhamnusium bicolor]